jgi:FlaA1/EpsC-like NDP-sugar epimerase
MRTFDPRELLPPRTIRMDMAAMKASVEGRRVLVTGAGGSVGVELCRHLVALGCESLTMIERHENSLHDLMLSLDAPFADPFLADILDAPRLEEVFLKGRPEVVFHAAAHKHVPLAERHAGEAVRNNITGTRLVMEAAERHGAGTFVLISTDKAVNPSSVMGATKRVAELLVRAARSSRTVFTSVRFGNVLGSNGSVLPRFVQQIRGGGPLTVTHPDVRRFFILIPEAVQLVIEATVLARPGSIYLLDMGQSIRIVDLARRVIEACGAPASMSIEFIGLRQGEKLDEDLVGAGERAVPTGLPHIAEIRSETVLPDSFASDVESLEKWASTGTNDGVIERLRAIVPEFVPYVPLNA